MNPIHVIGLGLGKEDLTANHLNIIKEADILVGGRTQLDLFPFHKGERMVIQGKTDELVRKIQELMKHKKITVLASGDPLFYGIGSVLVKNIASDLIQIHPNFSSISAAFAAIREPWQDAKIISLHGKTKQDFPFPSLHAETKVIFLTDPEKDPVFIAEQLLQFGINGFRLCVLERLGQANNEKIAWFDNASEVMNNNFSHPNLVILMKPRPKLEIHSISGETNVPHETYLGMNDDQFSHSKGLITKSEIRCISLSKLRLERKDHILWDIGAGSGSVSIEAAAMLPWGQVYSFEKNSDRIDHIVQNIERFNCPNIKLLNRNFPDGINDLVRPDRIFIGGGGENLAEIIRQSCRKLTDAGVIVINTVLIQNMDTAFRVLKENEFHPEMVQIQVSRSASMPFGDRLEALNPVWIIWGRKPVQSEKE